MRAQVESTLTLEAPRESVYGVLVAADGYRHWVPGVAAAEVLAQEGDITVVELRAAIAGEPHESTLSVELIHSPPETLHFRQVDLYAGLGVTGRLKLQAEGPRTLVHGRVQQPLPIYAFRRRRRLLRLLEQGLAALAGRVEQIVAASQATAQREREPGRRKILEVTRRPDGSTQVWYRGEVLP
jgi:uncharacterized protein YndB with AHSA1/START domain